MLLSLFLFSNLAAVVQGRDDVYLPRYEGDEADIEFPRPLPNATYPLSQLPSINGSAFPPYRTVFTRGECTGADKASTFINTDKTCFQCFRIPTMIKTNKPGTILAFAEARRGEGASDCPDGPDTRLVYKRSTNNGNTWSDLKVFLQPAGRAENGRCSIQAAPVVDPVTSTIFVGFNDNPCNGRVATSSIVKSTDDGVTWSTPTPLIVNGKAMSIGTGPIMGPTKGLAVTLPGGQVRLMLPGEGSNYRTLWSATIYSDDHGNTWHSNGTRALGEHDWTICSPGTCGGSRYVLVDRERVGTAISFSNDTVNWIRKTPTSADFPWSSRHGKPGVVSIPGGLLMSQQLLQCPYGVRPPCDHSTPDVIGNGMALWISRDGITWKLFKKLWPYGGMYSTMVPLSVDKDGAALTYAVIYVCGAVGGLSVNQINFQNFTYSPSDLDILDDQDHPTLMV